MIPWILLLVVASFSLASAEENLEYYYSTRKGVEEVINFRKNYTIPDGQCTALLSTENYPKFCKQPLAVEAGVVDSHDGEVWVSSRLHVVVVRRHTFLHTGSVGFCIGEATFSIGLACPQEVTDPF